MSTFEMCRNARVVIDQEPYRLLKRVEGEIWQLESEKTGRLVEHHQSTLLEMLRSGALVYAAADSGSGPEAPLPINDAEARRTGSRRAWEAASEPDRNLARQHLEYVKATIGRPRSKRHLRPVIARVAAARKDPATPSVSSIERWTQAYIRGGRDIVALLPNVKRRGNRRARIPERLATVIEWSIDAVYLTRERPTLQDTLDAAIKRVDRENRHKRLEEDDIPLPTRRMVQSLLARRDPFDVCVARYGLEYASHKYRQLLKGHRIQYGLQRVEVDHTQLNMIVIDDETFLPLGRPWLSAAIDARHRVFLGYALSFEPPSYLSVMRCLKHSIMPKTYLAQRFPTVRHEWPCHGIWDTAGLDNGKDLHAKALHDFADRYGIDLDYCPVRRPWIKGTIERGLGSLNRGVAHGKPGTTFEDLIQRGDYASASRACITLEALHEMVHIWIVDYYHQRVHRTLGMSPEQSWRQEMRHREIPLPASAVELDQALAIPMRRVLSHKGIELDHLVYNSPACRTVLARAGGSLEVDVGRPADDVGHVYVLDPQDERYVRVPVIERFAAYATGLTPWQHTQCVKYAQRHYGGRNDVVALADAKDRIRAGFVKAIAKIKAGAKRFAARFLGSASDFGATAQPTANTATEVRREAATPPASTNRDAPPVVAHHVDVTFSNRRSA